jgi:hypothetical protein
LSYNFLIFSRNCEMTVTGLCSTRKPIEAS